MAGSRDDMVFRPRLSRPETSAVAQMHARIARRVAEAASPRGILRKLARLRLVRAAKRRATDSLLGGVRIGRTARLASVGEDAAGLVTRGAGVALFAVVVAAIAAVRLGTGRPLEGLGADLNKAILGDLDDEARAKMATRRDLEGKPELMDVLGRAGRMTQQAKKIADDIYQRNLTTEKGRSRLLEAFPANGLIDMLIVRAAEAIRGAWSRERGDDAIANLKTSYRQLVGYDRRFK